MAKLGEGDPRWLVRDREDGRNVGSWHWEERTITKHATDVLREKLTGADLLEESSGFCTIKSVTKCTGEVTFCRRKGRNIFIYELNIAVKWEAPFSDHTLTGELEIPSYCQDEPIETTSMKFKCDQKGEAANAFLEVLRRQSKNSLMQIFGNFLSTLDYEYKVEKPPGPTFASSDGIKVDPQSDTNLSSSGGSPSLSSSSPSLSSSSPSSSSSAVSAAPSSSSPSSSAASSSPQPKKTTTKTLQTKILFQAPLSEIFLCLTDPNRISAFTGSAASFRAQDGETFELYDGLISGSFTSIKQNEFIIKKWRLKSWPADHFSEVRIDFEAVGGSSTRLKIKHSRIPSDEVDRTRDGWSSFFWSRIKAVFGFQYKSE